MRTIPLFLLLGAVLLSACSPRLSTFTKDLYNDYNWSDEQLKKVQFFLSDDLVIYRNIDEEGGVRVADGEIRVIDGKKVEQIRFRAGTPGVFLFRPQADHLAISFEDKDDTHYLVFGPNPKYDGRYMLLASEWNRRRGRITYAGHKFWTDSDVIPRLQVELERSGTTKWETRTAKGRRVN